MSFTLIVQGTPMYNNIYIWHIKCSSSVSYIWPTIYLPGIRGSDKELEKPTKWMCLLIPEKKRCYTFFFLCSWLCHDPWLLNITYIKCLQQYSIVPFKELTKVFWVFITYTTPSILLWKENVGTARINEELTLQISLLFSIAPQPTCAGHSQIVVLLPLFL